MKTCPRCHVEKPLEDFYRRSESKDGRMRPCKSCYDARRVEYVRSAHGRAAAVRATAAWRQRNPEYVYRPGILQNRARSVVNQAVSRGTLAKPDRCSRCATIGRVDAHHPNGYDRAHYYDIEWLCKPCHGVTHRKPERAVS